MSAVQLISTWPVTTAATAVVDHGEISTSHGPQDHRFPLASVTKLLTAYTSLVALEEGALELTMPAGPPGSTVRHLLAHAAGYEFDTHNTRGSVGERRMYSNTGFEVLAQTLTEHSGIAFAEYAQQAVLEPLAMTATDLSGSPAAGGVSTAQDLAVFARELMKPQLVHQETLRAATTTQFPGIAGLLPGFGRQTPNDWGLGFEIKNGKSPHWTGALNSPRTFGHFGQSGTFLWVDPERHLACVALTDRDFGAWAADVWPQFSDAVIREARPEQ
ncbi:serine hydrolase domain-containing protein [Jonesia quinghaiensis]|uniref:serine hydrolase domain-containing protein n=1 Tax=Jonesia quinghaiensis TaxID=262806 RepID=UPI000412D6FE|nr:serine hydrolase domain-containing protein [Jonesia quinghaiensis]